MNTTDRRLQITQPEREPDFSKNLITITPTNVVTRFTEREKTLVIMFPTNKVESCSIDGDLIVIRAHVNTASTGTPRAFVAPYKHVKFISNVCNESIKNEYFEPLCTLTDAMIHLCGGVENIVTPSINWGEILRG